MTRTTRIFQQEWRESSHRRAEGGLLAGANVVRGDFSQYGRLLPLSGFLGRWYLEMLVAGTTTRWAMTAMREFSRKPLLAAADVERKPPSSARWWLASTNSTNCTVMKLTASKMQVRSLGGLFGPAGGTWRALTAAANTAWASTGLSTLSMSPRWKPRLPTNRTRASRPRDWPSAKLCSTQSRK